MKNIGEILVYNIVALLSIVTPAVLVAYLPPSLSFVGTLLFLILWLVPGGNYGCIHVLVGGWAPFIISYPAGLYILLEEAAEAKL